MHISVTGDIGHFYHLQLTLTHVGNGRSAYLSKGFCQDVLHWRQLCRDVLNRPTFLAEVVQHLPTEFGLCDTSGLGSDSVCIDTNGCGSIFLWCLAWPKDIVEDLLIWSNLLGGITNPDLELLALVLQESCFPNVCSDHHWHTLATRYDNMPTVIWTFCESSNVNPVVANLLSLCKIWNCNTIISPSVLFHPSPESTMSGDTSSWLY